MTTIISTPRVKARFSDALAKQISVHDWITPSPMPCHEQAMVTVARKHGLMQSDVLVFSRYSAEIPTELPSMCVDGRVMSSFIYRSHSDIANWISTLGNYHKAPPSKALVLSMMKPFYLKWADLVYNSLRNGRYGAERTTRHLPDETTNLELAQELSRGCALGIYLGHGRSRGWSGYRGFRWNHVERFRQDKPIGTMISLSCSSLMQDKKGSIPLGIQWVMEGRNCVFLGATGALKIKPLEFITSILLESLSDLGVATIGQLVAQTNDRINSSTELDAKAMWSKFRLVGNPVQSL